LARFFDVITCSDLRYPGGTTASICEEIKAQAAVGYRSGLAHVASPRIRARLPFSPRVTACLQTGRAELVADAGPVHTRLLIIRHPAVLDRPDVQTLERIRAERVLLVVNQPPADDADPEPYYDLDRVRANLHGLAGLSALWAPIGPRVRQQLLKAAPDLPLLARDWHNVIDPDEWLVDRRRPVDSRPVLGRHSRPDRKKWPDRRADILRAYPGSAEVCVQILGAGPELRWLLPIIPANWTIHPFGSLPAKRFLAGIDFFVYFTHPGLIEAFGRNGLEALASGAVAILPPAFEPLFGPGGRYCAPGAVMGIVRELYGDWSAYLRQSAAGVEQVREHYSYPVHVARIRELAGPPSGQPAKTPRNPGRPRRTRVLMMSSNGAGIGHLTRLMAVARRAPEGIEPIFATLSRGISLVRRQGWLVEYLPSAPALGIGPAEWAPFLMHRMREVISAYHPAVIVFDGTMPFWGLVQAMLEQRGLPFVWLRRAMWKHGTGAENLARSHYFEQIIEPGEIAADVDRGVTAGSRQGVLRVDPILFLDPHELLERHEARRELGLDPQVRLCLIQLGAGNINRIEGIAERISDSVARHAGWQPIYLKSPISLGDGAPTKGLRSVTGYPFARLLRAFDAVVSAAGYNSFHELVAYGVPTLFVPNQETAIDDQAGRAAYAAREGLALCLDGHGSGAVDEAVNQLLDESIRTGLSERCLQHGFGNGAAKVMEAIVELAERCGHGRRLDRRVGR